MEKRVRDKNEKERHEILRKKERKKRKEINK